MSHPTTAPAQALWIVMEAREDWLGYGYLGERRHILAAVETGEYSEHYLAKVAAADAAVVARSVELGWTTDQLFEWVNSKAGRWFADEVFGCDVPLEKAVKSIGA